MLFDSHKEAVSGKILFYGNMLGFPGGKLGPKMDQNFGYVPFLLKYLILKDCLETVFLL